MRKKEKEESGRKHQHVIKREETNEMEEEKMDAILRFLHQIITQQIHLNTI